MSDLATMPDGMRRLALVQFCTWSALFILWVFTTPVVAMVAFGTRNPTSQAYADGADWVGVLFATYNGAAALTAFLLPLLAKRIGRRATHILCLLGGAIGFALIPQIHNPTALLAPMLLVSSVMGVIGAHLFPGDPRWTLFFAAGALATAALAMTRVAPKA